MAKKKDAFTSSADASVLRRSGRETPSKKQTPSSSVNPRKSERLQKHTSPTPSPAKNKPEKIEKQMGPSPLRRSDRGKKLVETTDIPNIKSTKDKTANNLKQSSEDVIEDKKTEKQDPNVGGRKRKFDAIRYKALFKSQRIRTESDVDKELKNQNSIRIQGVPDKDHKASLEGRVIDLDPIEHDDCPQTKSLDGKAIENGEVEKKSGGGILPSNGNFANSDNHMSHTSSYRIEHDLENQQELDNCHKVTETCKAVGSMENAENNDVSSNMQNYKFVEFWVPVKISNVQLEQYCATLLSNATVLCSSSKSDTLGALRDTLFANRKCCNHPYSVDPKVEQSLIKDKDPSMVVDVITEASGKLQFLDHILPEIQKHQLKVVILFQHTSGALSGSFSLGRILVEFVDRRFGPNSYEHVDGFPNISSKKQAAINKFNIDMAKFIFLLESRACHQSIKLSSVDAIIIFDSEINPSNDLKSLQKLSIGSQSEQIMIFRLYSLSTLEEKIFKLAENNMALDIRSHSLRSNYDALLMWGASDLFDKLTEFHNQTVPDISSEESFLKDVAEEFLNILSHKCRSNETTSKSIITRVQNCGIYGKNTLLHCEVKTHLPDGVQPCIFWKKLLDGRCPAWKFVSDSSPRQRKRPNFFLEGKSGVDGGGVKTRRKTVNNSTIEPAQLKTLTGGETGGVNQGISAATNESQSSSGDHFWSTSVNDETSLLDLLKPTVSELCSILKFSEDVKITVERFLEYVVENYNVGKDHTSTLQAFMISLCWIGSSLAKNIIDRSESFVLATKHFDFSCTEDQTETVYIKLNQVKETFLKHTQILPALNDCDPAPGVKSGTEKSQHITNADVSNESVSRKGVKAFEKINREWDEKRASLENEYKVDKAMTHAIFHSNPSLRSEKLEIIEREYANKFKELDSQKRLWEVGLEEVNATTMAAEGPVVADNKFSLRQSQHEIQVVHSGNPEVAPTLPVNAMEAQSHDEPVCEGANDIESTGSHTSEKEMVDAAVSSEQIGVPSQQHADDMEVDVAEKVDASYENAKGGTSCPPLAFEDPVEDHNETGANDVSPHVDCGDMEMPAGNDNKEYEDGTVGLDENEHSETCVNDIAQHVYSGDVEKPAGNDNKENDVGTIGFDENDHNETGANDMGPHVESGDMGMPAGNYHKENDECGIVGLDASHIVEDGHKTVDVATEVESAEMATPADTCDRESPEEGEIQPDSPDAGGDYNETSPNDVLPCVVSAEMATSAGTFDRESPEECEIQPDAADAGGDHNETSPKDVLPCVVSDEMATPTGTCDIDSPEEGEIQPDAPDAGHNHNETRPDDVLPCVGSVEMAAPADNEEDAEDSIIRPDALHANEDHNVSCGAVSANPVHAAISQDKSPSVQPVSSPASDHLEPIIPDGGVQDEEINVGNPQPSGGSQLDQNILDDEPDIPSSTDPVYAAISQDKTPSVQPVSSPASDRIEPIFLVFQESQNGPLQLEQLPDSGVQGEEVNVGSLQPSGASQLDQIILDNEPEIPSSTDPTVAENLSNTLPPSGPLFDPICEEPTRTVLQSGENLEENHVPASETPHEERQPNVATSVAPVPLVNRLNMFDNLTNRVSPQMANLTDPLQVEVDRLSTVKDNVTKLYQEMKQRLDAECKKEIEEVTQQIRLKYEARHQEADAAYNSKTMELETNINRVTMNKILAGAFRSKCQEHTPSGHPVSQAGIMQHVHRLSVSPSMRHYHGASSSSPGQSSENQQPPQPPTSLPLSLQQPQPQVRPQLPLQIVHQPAALFSSTPSRPPSTTPNRPPSNTSFSTTPSRPPPVVNQISTSPATSRQLPTGPPPIVIQVTPSTTPTSSRPPPGINMSSLSALHKRAPPSISHIDMSAANLRISTETRRQSPHMRPVVSSEPRAPAPSIRPVVSSEPGAAPPNIRPMVSSEPRAPPPHMRPSVNREPRAPAPHLRSMASTEIRARAPHIQPFRSTAFVTPDVGTHPMVLQSQHVTSGPSKSPIMPPFSSSSPQSLTQTPSEPGTMALSPPSAQTPFLSSDNLNLLADNAPRWVNVTTPQPGRLEVTDYIREGAANSSSALDLVCLSDDD